jgi:hypothetical protein
VLNSGYKRGATRPTLVPDKDSGWRTAELPTFAAVALAGIDPLLPDDTRSRTITVHMLPDETGSAEESDWEYLEPAAQALAQQIAAWAQQVHLPEVRTLPPGCVGRMREKWRPLARVAAALGGPWPDRCEDLILRELDERASDREEGLVSTKPSLVLLRDLAAVWPADEDHVRTADLIVRLQAHNPDAWVQGPKGALTAQAIGRMLGRGFKIRSRRNAQGERIGYARRDLERVWRRTGTATPPPTRRHP